MSTLGIENTKYNIHIRYGKSRVIVVPRGTYRMKICKIFHSIWDPNKFSGIIFMGVSEIQLLIFFCVAISVLVTDLPQSHTYMPNR